MGALFDDAWDKDISENMLLDMDTEFRIKHTEMIEAMFDEKIPVSSIAKVAGVSVKDVVALKRALAVVSR